MEKVNYNAQSLQQLVANSVFKDEPFVLIDVGCSGGIADVYRQFGKSLIAHGIDPQQSEIARLNESESHPHVHYHAYFVGLPDNHDYIQRRRQQQSAESDYFNPWQRLSAAYASQIASIAAPQQSNPTFQDLTSVKISVSEFVGQQGLQHVDFIKTDTDGSDFEAILSCRDIIESHQPLGFMIEAPFTGSDHDTANSFHNIDRLMRSWGFNLYGMEICHYSRRHLPAQFKYDILAQTVSGQPIWADVLYLRDPVNANYERIAGHRPTIAKYLKLASLFELFQLQDCAAELIVEKKEEVRQVANPDLLLDSLTPQLNGRSLSYQEYVNTFLRKPSAFFPSNLGAA